MKKLSSIGLFLLFLSSCSGQQKEVPAPPPSVVPAQPAVTIIADFGTQGTFRMIPLEETMPLGIFGDEVFEGIAEVVQEGMEQRGFSLAGEAPDLLVAVYVMRERRIDSGDWGIDLGWHGDTWNRYWNDRHPLYAQQKEGTVIVDVLDASERTILWSAMTPSVLFPDLNRATLDPLAGEALRTLLEQLPRRR